MNIKKIIDNKGATLDKNLKAINKNCGYMVSKIGYEKTFSINELDELEKSIREYQKLLKNNEYIGIWIDNNIIYLDISKHYLALDKAKKVGIKNKQLAIYDLKNEKSIDLTKTAYIVYKYNKINNDLIYYNEFYKIEDIAKEFNLSNKNSIYNYIVKDIEENFTNLLNNNYVIITENIPLFEEL